MAKPRPGVLPCCCLASKSHGGALARVFLKSHGSCKKNKKHGVCLCITVLIVCFCLLLLRFLIFLYYFFFGFLYRQPPCSNQSKCRSCMQPKWLRIMTLLNERVSKFTHLLGQHPLGKPFIEGKNPSKWGRTSKASIEPAQMRTPHMHLCA